MTDVAATCETCRFWHFPPNAHGNCTIGQCRRHAPTYNGAHRSHWCNTTKMDWCGEHQPSTALMEEGREG